LKREKEHKKSKRGVKSTVNTTTISRSSSRDSQGGVGGVTYDLTNISAFNKYFILKPKEIIYEEDSADEAGSVCEDIIFEEDCSGNRLTSRLSESGGLYVNDEAVDACIE
jgi:hypothetical protein